MASFCFPSHSHVDLHLTSAQQNKKQHNWENNRNSSNIWLRTLTDQISLIYSQCQRLRMIGWKLTSSCTWLVMSDELLPAHLGVGWVGAVDFGWWDLIMLINGLDEKEGKMCWTIKRCIWSVFPDKTVRKRFKLFMLCLYMYKYVITMGFSFLHLCKLINSVDLLPGIITFIFHSRMLLIALGISLS